jgi:regulator of protease activity HflC (stomatin/prohibitin superfamily)
MSIDNNNGNKKPENKDLFESFMEGFKESRIDLEKLNLSEKINKNKFDSKSTFNKVRKGQKKAVTIFVLIWAAIFFGPLLGSLNIPLSVLFNQENTMWILILILLFLALSGLRIVDQFERGVILTLGKYTGTKNPGLTWILWPFGIQRMLKVDMRVKSVDVPDQKAITKDNISVNVNAVIYYKVTDANRAVLEVEDFYSTMSQVAQTTMRDIVGEVELDQLLTERENISERIRNIVDKISDPWGITVSAVSLKDVALPVDMERTIAKQAEAEREKRAVIIKAEGEVAASENMSKAAKILSETPGALHLRTLQSLNDLSSDQSNTVIFALPIEVLRAFEGMKGGDSK